MSSDVRRTTIEDAVTEAALEVRRNFSPMAADEILIALNSEHMSKARAALYAAVDRTRPPEAARSPYPVSDDDRYFLRQAGRILKDKPGLDALGDRLLRIEAALASSSPDPRGRSGDTVAWLIERDVAGSVHYLHEYKDRTKHARWPLEVGWTTNPNHATKFATEIAARAYALAASLKEPSDIWVSAKVVEHMWLDPSTAQPPAAPATTGASAEAVADWPNRRKAEPEDLRCLNCYGYGWCRGNSSWPSFECQKCNGTGLATPPEVTHGAAIGGDVVTDALHRLLDYIKAMDARQSKKNENAMFIDARSYYGLKCEAGMVEKALEERATASTRPDGGDVGRGAK